MQRRPFRTSETAPHAACWAESAGPNPYREGATIKDLEFLVQGKRFGMRSTNIASRLRCALHHVRAETARKIIENIPSGRHDSTMEWKHVLPKP